MRKSCMGLAMGGAKPHTTLYNPRVHFSNNAWPENPFSIVNQN